MRHRPVSALLLVLAPLVLPPVLGAQSNPPGAGVHPDKKRVAEEVARKRADMRDGRIDRFNVRVRVKLKNGAKLSGVVKNGRLVEREEGIDFVEADRNTQDAGIRLYYFDETTSFVFLRWADIESHKVVVKMSDDEVRALEQELAERERKRVEERQQQANRPADAAPGTPPDPSTLPPGAKPAPGQGAEPKPAPAETPLLTEFPPAEGWGDERVQEIQRRKIAVGAFPNEKEKRFLEVFEDWKKQRERAQGQTAGVKPPTPAK